LRGAEVSRCALSKAQASITDVLLQHTLSDYYGLGSLIPEEVEDKLGWKVIEVSSYSVRFFVFYLRPFSYIADHLLGMRKSACER
jgi:hypothetical protein